MAVMEAPAINCTYTLKARIKQHFCKQHVYKTISNFYGDAIIDVSLGRKQPIRSLLCCVNCGKLLFSPFLDSKCKIINLNFEECDK